MDVSVGAGDFTGCVKTEERSVLEPDVQEFKYYCAGVGNVLVEEEDVTEELTGRRLVARRAKLRATSPNQPPVSTSSSTSASSRSSSSLPRASRAGPSGP